jgi:thiamine-phosphate pyrophosphorylase
VTEAAVRCQLYLLIDTHAGAIAQLAASLDAGPIAAVLVRPVAGKVLDATLAQSLIELAQARDVAVLLADDARMARTLRADGVHLTSGDDVVARYRDAREIIGDRAMIGVDPGASRHVAMELAELNADYIAFGAMASTEDDFDRDALLAWWAEIFQVPCVAMDIADVDDAGRVAALGVDFVAVALPYASTGAEAGKLIADYSAAVVVVAQS